MEFNVRDHKDWVVVELEDRVDAFNCGELTGQVSELLKKGHQKIAFDLANTRFLGLPSIKFVSSVATDVESRGGRCVLLSPSEKIKRQFDIFASLNSIQIFPSQGEWKQGLS